MWTELGKHKWYYQNYKPLCSGFLNNDQETEKYLPFTVQGQEEINDKHAVRRVANEEWQQYIVVYTHLLN